MAFFTPLFRSRRDGDRLLGGGQIVLIGLITWLAPALVGGSMILLITVLGMTTSPEPVAGVIGAYGGMLVLAPFVGIFVVPAALVVGMWALRLGVAGWASALIAGTGVPLAVAGLIDWSDQTAAAVMAVIALTPVIVLHVLVLWSATRWLCPDALIPPAEGA
ncbi:hypothetical protein [Roseicyclus mahoneyensis]|uniref:Uncharacterized protein n=1 Tax=Roseicyclus mahoneyensis TaxID=164332 RepID=A0A316GIA0_9RHOB|nr:hypothetical protein [Roseicyclus mahoneyensis]PWK60701.1 hypothetical protein C7455_104339 [Roseicyclus mahoneyensis]